LVGGEGGGGASQAVEAQVGGFSPDEVVHVGEGLLAGDVGAAARELEALARARNALGGDAEGPGDRDGAARDAREPVLERVLAHEEAERDLALGGRHLAHEVRRRAVHARLDRAGVTVGKIGKIERWGKLNMECGVGSQSGGGVGN